MTESGPSHTSLDVSDRGVALFVGMFLGNLSMTLLMGLPVTLALVLVSQVQMGSALTTIILVFAVGAGVTLCAAAGSAFATKSSLSWTFAAGAMIIPVLLALRILPRWADLDTWARWFIIIYAASGAGLPLGFLGARWRGRRKHSDDGSDGDGHGPVEGTSA